MNFAKHFSQINRNNVMRTIWRLPFVATIIRYIGYNMKMCVLVVQSRIIFTLLHIFNLTVRPTQLSKKEEGHNSYEQSFWATLWSWAMNNGMTLGLANNFFPEAFSGPGPTCRYLPTKCHHYAEQGKVQMRQRWRQNEKWFPTWAEPARRTWTLLPASAAKEAQTQSSAYSFISVIVLLVLCKLKN